MSLKKEEIKTLFWKRDPVCMKEKEVEQLFGKPNVSKENEWIYYLESKWVFSRRLHFYFSEKSVIDYCIYSYIMGLRVF